MRNCFQPLERPTRRLKTEAKQEEFKPPKVTAVRIQSAERIDAVKVNLRDLVTILISEVMEIRVFQA